MLVQELEPGGEYHSEITCKHEAKGRRCQHRKPIIEEQVKYLLKTYPGCDTRDYTPSAWSRLFE
jgi:hypothetical protein